MRSSKSIVICFAVCCVFMLSCGPKLDTDKGKYSYALGSQVGSSMKKDGIDIDVKAFVLGFKEGLEGETDKSLSEKDMIDGLKAMTLEIQKKKAEAEAAKKAAK
jgi:FKBP-type peptidyl-prolyl cis-trans isomerase FklB